MAKENYVACPSDRGLEWGVDVKPDDVFVLSDGTLVEVFHSNTWGYTFDGRRIDKEGKLIGVGPYRLVWLSYEAKAKVDKDWYLRQHKSVSIKAKNQKRDAFGHFCKDSNQVIIQKRDALGHFIKKEE